MKKKILLLLLISAVTIVSLLLWSKYSQEESHYNFKRNYSNTIKFTKVMSIQSDNGVNKLDIFNNQIYLLDFKNKIINGYDLNGRQILSHKILTNNQSFIFESFGVEGDSIDFSFPSQKAFLTTKKNISGYIKHPLNVFYSRAIKTNDGFLVKGSVKKQYTDEVFINLDKKGNEIGKNDIFFHTHNGGILQDGFFIRDAKYILFVSYFLPEIFCFDVNGQFLKKISTVDNLLIKQKVERIGNTYTFKNIPFTHQLTGAVSNDHLFVSSAIIEDSKKNEFSQVIDVYRIKDGKYLKSIILPNNNDVFDFKIVENNIFILSKNKELIKYTVEQLY